MIESKGSKTQLTATISELDDAYQKLEEAND